VSGVVRVVFVYKSAVKMVAVLLNCTIIGQPAVILLGVGGGGGGGGVTTPGVFGKIFF